MVQAEGRTGIRGETHQWPRLSQPSSKGGIRGEDGQLRVTRQGQGTGDTGLVLTPGGEEGFSLGSDLLASSSSTSQPTQVQSFLFVSCIPAWPPANHLPLRLVHCPYFAFPKSLMGINKGLIRHDSETYLLAFVKLR